MDRRMLADRANRTAGELRLHLAQIAAANQMLESRVSDPKGREYLSIVNQGICRMLRVVGRLELAHRLTDEDEIRLFPAEVEFGEWAGRLGSRIQDALAGAGVAFYYSAPEYLAGGADGELLEQMVLELVSNGAGAGDEVSFTVAGDGGKVCLTVKDNGTGMDAGTLARVLSGGQESDEGCGVAIARQIAELHGGTLMGVSAPGEGTSMMATIPLRRLPMDNRLESPRRAWDGGGFDPVLVALSDRLPPEAFRPENLG